MSSISLNVLPKRIAQFLAVTVVWLILMSFLVSVMNIGVATGDNITAKEKAANNVVRIFTDFFFVNKEGNLPSWYSGTALLFTSAIIMVIALLKRQANDGYKWHWFILSLIFFYLAVDESAQIHEAINQSLRVFGDSSGFLHFLWIIPAGILTVIFALAYLRFLFHLPPRQRVLFIIAGVMYVTGALVLESVAGYIIEQLNRPGSFLEIVSIHLEELLEMLGIVVFIYALLTYLHTITNGAFQINVTTKDE